MEQQVGHQQIGRVQRSEWGLGQRLQAMVNRGGAAVSGFGGAVWSGFRIFVDSAERYGIYR